MNSSYRREAEIFGRYLLGRQPSGQAIALYEQAMQKLNIIVTGSDERLLRFSLNNPWSLGLVDSGLALAKPRSAIRRKLLIMLAILEAIPEYAELFLPSPVPIVTVFFTGCSAAVKAVLGIILVRLV